MYLKILCPNWRLGLGKIGLVDGLKKYGVIGVVIALVGCVAFYVGLMPFDRQPSVAKVLVEGVVYYIGVSIIEELYVRGLLLNLIEKVCALPYCFSNISGYADLTLYIVVPAYIILGIYSLIELKKTA